MFKIIKLSINNLIKKKLSSVLLMLFLGFGFSVLLFLEVGKSYLENLTNTVYTSNIGNNKLVVEKNSSAISSLFNNIVKSNISFNESEIKKINSIEGIKKIYKSSNFNDPAIMSIELLGNKFTTDIFLEGIEEEIFIEEFKKFNSDQDYIPLIVSDKIVNSLIAIFVKDKSANKITKELILGKEFDMIFGKSTLTRSDSKSVSMKGKIVGFGEGSNFMLISIPFSSLEKINNSLGKSTNIEKLFIETDTYSDVDSIQLQIEKLGFVVSNGEEEKAKIKNIISIFYNIGLVFVIIIISIITYSLISFIIMRIVESRKDNSIMYALGITRKTISKIYIVEGFILTLLGLLLSLGLIFISLNFINNFINNYNSTHNFINLGTIDFSLNNIISLIILFIIINIIIISLTCLKIWKTDLKKGV